MASITIVNIQSNHKRETIYQYHAVQSDGWRFHFSTNKLLGQGWKFDTIAFYGADAKQEHSVPVYQYHCDQSKTYGGWRFHFSTNSNLQQGWTKDGIAFYAFNKQLKGTVPIYQYHAVQNDGWRFHFSTNKNLQQGWTKDGIAFYAYNSL